MAGKPKPRLIARIVEVFRAAADVHLVGALASVFGLVLAIAVLVVRDTGALVVFATAVVIVFGGVIVYGLLRHERSGGLFRVLDETHEWVIEDRDGQHAVMRRNRRAQVLQDGIFALRDFVWGTKGSHTNPRGTPYEVVHTYISPDGLTTALLLMDDVKRRLEEIQYEVRWDVNDVFVDDINHVESIMLFPTRQLTLRVIFPSGRVPQEAHHVRQHAPNKPERLEIAGRRDGRHQVEVVLRNPRPNTVEKIAWRW